MGINLCPHGNYSGHCRACHTLPPPIQVIHVPPSESVQLAALRQRVEDMQHAVNVCIEPSEQVEALRSVLELKWQFIPPDLAKKGIDAITTYLWDCGVRA